MTGAFADPASVLIAGELIAPTRRFGAKPLDLCPTLSLKHR
ncbi:hypothetical protein [Tabrizicola sp.]|nr:hypothetical protein [Tabrizicola sp.]